MIALSNVSRSCVFIVKALLAALFCALQCGRVTGAITGAFTLDGEIGGMTGVVTSIPWQAFSGDAVYLFGYCDYAKLLPYMDHSSHVPYVAIVDGKEYGLVSLALIKYDNSTTGPYDEVVISAVSSLDGKKRVAEACLPDDISCMFIELAFKRKPTYMHVLAMWLDEPLPVATGIQMYGINKFLADTLDIEQAQVSDNEMRWSIQLEDNATDTYLSISLRDAPPTPSVEINTAVNMVRAMIPVVTQLGTTPDFPTGAAELLDRANDMYVARVHDSYFAHPLGVFPQNFGNTTGTLTRSIVTVRGEDYGVKRDDGCDLVYESSGGILKDIGFRPVACTFMHDIAVEIIPPEGPEFREALTKNLSELTPEVQDTIDDFVRQIHVSGLMEPADVPESAEAASFSVPGSFVLPGSDVTAFNQPAGVSG